MSSSFSQRQQRVLLLFAAFCHLPADGAESVDSILRSALQGEQDKATTFDAEMLHRAFPDTAKRKLPERYPAGTRYAAPDILLDLAFGGVPDGVDHTPMQQRLQLWLYGLCNRLPVSGSEIGLRRECTERLTALAARIQGAVHTHDQTLRRSREDVVQFLNLHKRATYYQAAADPAEAAADVAQAQARAMANPEVQRLLRIPKVKAAMERIASNPAAVAEYADDPEVTSALAALNELLQG